MMEIVATDLKSLMPLWSEFLKKDSNGIAIEQNPGLVSTFYGHDVQCFLYTENNAHAGYVIVRINKKIVAEVVHGPVLHNAGNYTESIKLLKEALAKPIMALRVLPPLNGYPAPGFESHFDWATIIIDLKRTKEEILASFNYNHRHSIKTTLKHGVVVSILTANDAADYAKGLVAVYKNRGIKYSAEDAKNTFEAFVESIKNDPGAGFVLGVRDKDNNSLLAGGLFVRSGHSIIYKEGFSLRKHSLALSHVIIWEAMCMAKEMGCTQMDMCGYSLKKEDKQLMAINRFKKWFRGEVVVYPPTVVYNLFPFASQMMKMLGRGL